MNKNYLPLTIRYAEVIKKENKIDDKEYEKRFISIKKLQTSKSLSESFHRPISKIIADDE